MMRPNTIPIHPGKAQMEGRKTKADVQVDIRPALSQWESAPSGRAVQQLAMNRYKRCDEIIVSM